MQTFKKILYLLNPQERYRAGLLLIIMIIMALVDMIGVASILPFIAVLTNPDIIETNIILKKMFQALNIFGVENNQQFTFVLGILVLLLLITSLVFKALGTYVQARFVQMREYSIAKRLIEGYLHQPYSWFLNRNSADLGKTILSEVSVIIGNGLRPMMELISKGLVAITLISLLIIIDTKIALIIGFLLSLTYGLIFYFIESYLKRIGQERLKSNQLRFIAVNEALGAVKEVKIGGLEQVYIKRFSDPAQIYTRTSISSDIIGQLPRFAFEAIVFGGIMLVILFLMAQKGSLNNALPIISLCIINFSKFYWSSA